MDSSIWWYIALAILVAGLIIAGIGVGMFIKGMKEPMKKMKGSADNLKERVDKLKLEATSLQHHVTELSEEMKVKSEKVSVLVDAGKGTANSVIDLNAAVKAVTDDIASRVERDKGNAREVQQVSDTTVGLLTFWQNLKTVKTNNTIYYPTAVPPEEQR